VEWPYAIAPVFKNSRRFSVMLREVGAVVVHVQENAFNFDCGLKASTGRGCASARYGLRGPSYWLLGTSSLSAATRAHSR